MDKFCECGCGKPTPLATKTRRGNTKGQPTRYLRGHSPSRALPANYTVNAETGCWEWGLTRNPQTGYGIWNGRYAHRKMYERHVGPIPEGMEIDHLCRNRACVNPTHLEPVTHAENARRGLNTKLNHEIAAAIRASDESHAALGRKYGVSATVIFKVRNGQAWVAA